MAVQTKPKSDPGPQRGGAAGHRLASAFVAVSAMPALREARRRLLRAIERGEDGADELTAAIESDAAIAVAVMRAANNGPGPSGRCGGVREAVESLPPDKLVQVAGRITTFDPLERSGSERLERFRRHAVATKQAAEKIGEILRLPDADELAVAALLHDVGRLVLVEMYSEERIAGFDRLTPEERVRAERRELGIDHGLVGGVLLRRWGLRQSVASTVERHHAPDATGHAAAVRLADLIAHQAAGDPVGSEELARAGASLGIDQGRLRELLFDFPYATQAKRRSAAPCPLSARELDALRGLAEGKVYKQIASELDLSVSTVRTHLHNVYRKIGAVDRAQAVLIARDKDWI
ncbi:HDOD domain-containing protein [Thermoleophilia bacterium SCSIO 60948]|nr:HDOD domain-containing protein [Thermoleophilia bacterium SCSIO 60948]